MDRDKLVARLTATFLEELDEHVRIFNRELLALEQEPNEPWAERIKTLFRSAHSLKGAARAVSAARVEAICHRLEGVLAGVRDGQSPPTKELFELLFAAADAIDHAGKAFAGQGGVEHEIVINAVLTRLGAVYAGNGRLGSSQARSATPAPQSPPPERLANARAEMPVPAPAPAPPANGAMPPSERTGPVPSSERAVAATPNGAIPNGETTKTAATQTARTPSSPPTARKASPSAPPGAPGRGGAPADAGNVIRVRGSKLDVLLAQSGELLVARRRLEARRDQLATLQEFATRWRAEWRIVDKSLAKRVRKLRSGDESSNGTSNGKANGHLTMTPRAERVLLRNHENLRRLERDLDHLALSCADDRRAIERAAVPLEEQIRQVRMLPFSDACEGLFRVVRDLAGAQGKEVELVIENGDTELDRSLLDALRDPLVHLVRNAIDHGIELPSQRGERGKSARARIAVSATVRGSWVEISVQDDGRGIDVAAIAEQARRKGIGVPEDPSAIARLIFTAGFSTARMITEVSGRGVGLDVVKTQVEQWRGAVDVSFEPGKWTRFALTMPLTLTTIRALMVVVSGQTFAIPSAQVERLVRIDADAMRTIEGREVILLGKTPVPVGSLSTLFAMPPKPLGANQRSPTVVLTVAGQLAAIVVDDLLAEQEVVLKSLGDRLKRMKYVSGATILPNGRIAPVLTPSELLRDVVAKPAATSIAKTATAEGQIAAKRLILADDSVTTRALEKSILEAAGYEVLTAVDGSDAWHLLQDRGADLVVSDVEMPKMDGFSLTETIRSSKRFKSLPVVLVTALETDRDRARGLEAGADAYLPKSTFDQKALLDAIRQLI
ncbi:MAG: hybrid sensor histidine kinase/response regulator [Polyangiaceae bacterium]